MSWASDLKRIADKSGESLGELAQGVKIAAFSEAVQNTRVREGRLKGNWNIQENRPDRSTTEAVDPTGARVLAKIARKVTADGITYFTNNLPYAIVYEKKDAMVGLAIALVRKDVRDAARRLG